ncbi:MAG: substrate-binding domain-containing protein [Clostridiaceae bacterium]|uniref:Sugar ABC transporter substrate-binding protein n=1 Tax=Clostridium porci TaxID=2605778 RepID=A0A7X2TDN6_9CLOT|nr:MULTISPECIES: substrate-binding domain-containing protein [Clostridium]MCI6138880.1 substrate-binding domain-containing protein [Clostridium sp.]MDY3230527.1 substrate-binding domain-containing protein [Clostridiaceae bacterium]MSS37313.1 sugar ABC transporter substrate-binding protein [Clostridium porci]
MLRKKIAGILGVLLAAGLILTGCSKAKVNESTQAAANTEGQTPEEQNEKAIIGVSLATLQFPFYQDMQRGIQNAAGDDIELAFVDCNGDEQVQMNSIENFIQMGCKAVIMTYQNFDTLKNICTPLNDAGIPIILCDAGPTDFVYQAIGTDNRIGGRTAGKWAAEQYLKDVDRNEALDIIVLIPPSGTSAKARAEGFEEEILKVFPNSNIETFGKSADRQDFMSTMEDALSSHSSLDLVFGYSAQAGMGAYDAIISAKNEHTKVIGFDATDEEKGAIDKAEDSPYVATVMQYPEKMGELAVQTIRDYILTGKELPEEEKYINAGVGLYTYGGKIITAEEIALD